MVVKPDTVIAWRGQGYRLFWRWMSRTNRRGRAGPPQESADLFRVWPARIRPSQVPGPRDRVQRGSLGADPDRVLRALPQIAKASLARTQRDRAALLKESGARFTREASIAKLFASQAANRIAYRAVQIHGGTGFINECRVEQLYCDARVTTIYEGTSEIQRLVIAREVLK